MAYEDRILRMVRQKESAPFNDAKDRFRALQRQDNMNQKFPGRFPRRALQRQNKLGLKNQQYRQQLQGKGLGSFENQLRGPVGMGTMPEEMILSDQKRSIQDLLQYIKKKEDPYIIPDELRKFTPEKRGIPEDSPDPGEEPLIIPIPVGQPGDSQGTFVGDTDYNSDEKQFLNELNLTGPFNDARDVNPEISVEFGGSPDQEFFDTYGVPMRGNIELNTDGEKIYGLGDRLTKDMMLDSNNLRNFGLGKPPGTPIVNDAAGIPVGYEETFTDTLARPSSLFGGEDTTTGDPAYAVGLDAFNKYNMFNPRQEGLDYMAPEEPRPSWDNPIGNFFRKFNPFNRGGIASLRR